MNEESGRKNIEDLEAAAMDALSLELGLHIALLREAFRIIVLATRGIGGPKPLSEVPPGARVCMSLLTRIANDLRGIEVIAHRGYALQAATIAAATFETAYAIAHIAGHEDRAARWIEHTDLKNSYEKTKRCVQAVLRESGVADVESLIRSELEIYQQLCLAKHSNPVLQSQHGLSADEKSVGWVIGPVLDEETIRVLWYALTQASRLACVAAIHFSRRYIADAALKELAERVVPALGEVDRIAQRAAERGWGHGPFQGKQGEY
jgi:hypothetical protein